MRLLRGVFLRLQTALKGRFHLRCHHLHPALLVRHPASQLIESGQHFAGRRVGPAAGQRGAVSGGRFPVVPTGEKLRHLVVLLKALRYGQPLPVGLIISPLDQLIFKNILPAEEHLHAGVQGKSIHIPIYRIIFFRYPRENGGADSLNHRIAPVHPAEDPLTVPQHPGHVDAHQVKYGLLRHFHLGHHLAQLIVGRLHHVHVNAGLLLKQGQEPLDGLPRGIVHREETDRLLLPGGVDLSLGESALLRHLRDAGFSLSDLSLVRFPLELLFFQYDLRDMLAHELVVHLIHIPVFHAEILAHHRVDPGQLPLGIVAVGHFYIFHILSGHGDNSVKGIRRVEQVKSPVEFHKLRGLQHLEIATLALHHLGHALDKAPVVGVPLILTEKGHAPVSVPDAFFRDLPPRLLIVKGDESRVLRKPFHEPVHHDHHGLLRHRLLIFKLAAHQHNGRGPQGEGLFQQPSLRGGHSLAAQDLNGVILLVELLFDPGVQFPVHLQVNPGDNDADIFRPSAPQLAGLGIDLVAQGPGRLLHQLDLLGAHISLPVQHVGNCAVGHPRVFCYILDRGHKSVSSHL